jgi:hypothetical protein
MLQSDVRYITVVVLYRPQQQLAMIVALKGSTVANVSNMLGTSFASSLAMVGALASAVTAVADAESMT